MVVVGELNVASNIQPLSEINNISNEGGSVTAECEYTAPMGRERASSDQTFLNSTPYGTLSRSVRQQLLAQWGVAPGGAMPPVRQMKESFKSHLSQCDLAVGDILPQQVINRQSELHSLIESFRSQAALLKDPAEVSFLVEMFAVQSMALLHDDMVMVNQSRSVWVENKFASFHAPCASSCPNDRHLRSSSGSAFRCISQGSVV